jgi:hypothetical protein
MSREEALAKLISVRHYCFLRGVLGKRSGDRKLDRPPEDDFRAAFREVNRLYVQLGDGKAHIASPIARGGPHATQVTP